MPKSSCTLISVIQALISKCQKNWWERPSEKSIWQHQFVPKANNANNVRCLFLQFYLSSETKKELQQSMVMMKSVVNSFADDASEHSFHTCQEDVSCLASFSTAFIHFHPPSPQWFFYMCDLDAYFCVFIASNFWSPWNLQEFMLKGKLVRKYWGHLL